MVYSKYTLSIVYSEYTYKVIRKYTQKIPKVNPGYTQSKPRVYPEYTHSQRILLVYPKPKEQIDSESWTLDLELIDKMRNKLRAFFL